MIAFPDVTLTLDAMSTALSPLLSKHPDGAFFLLGLPTPPPPRARAHLKQLSLFRSSAFKTAQTVPEQII